jgi:hypothetical protein
MDRGANFVVKGRALENLDSIFSRPHLRGRVGSDQSIESIDEPQHHGQLLSWQLQQLSRLSQRQR